MDPNTPEKWDFRKVRFEIREKMRYDTPGDYQGNVISAWSGLPELSQKAVLVHEFTESLILRAAGITDEQIDIMDHYKEVTGRFSKPEFEFAERMTSWGELTKAFDERITTVTELVKAAVAYEAIPKWIRNLYDEAHVIALIAERAYLEAAGGNWKEHDALIEATRGKIPHE